MQDQMIDAMREDLRFVNERLLAKKDHARLRECIDADERRRASGNRRYTPPKARR